MSEAIPGDHISLMAAHPNLFGDIPDDVMKAADAAHSAAAFYSDPSEMTLSIARAIMAERERCASIDFEPIVAQFVACLGDDGLPCDHFCRCNAAAEDIAAAIRKGEA